jgi:Cdc6-like AAA superfamily ATPase
VIPLASVFAAQTHGDARKAIDLVRVAGELAEREGNDRIREEHVRDAQDKVEKNRVLEVTRDISTQRSSVCMQQQRLQSKPMISLREVQLGITSINFSLTLSV